MRRPRKAPERVEDLGWRADIPSDHLKPGDDGYITPEERKAREAEFSRGFDEHFAPGLSGNPLWVKSEWDVAFEALNETPANPDLLALALQHSYPPPRWVCQRLSDMISSGASSNDHDRLEFSRSRAHRKKLRTNERRIRAGAAYFAARAAGKNENDSFTAALNEAGYSDESFARKARALFNKLPDYLKRRALAAHKGARK